MNKEDLKYGHLYFVGGRVCNYLFIFKDIEDNYIVSMSNYGTAPSLYSAVVVVTVKLIELEDALKTLREATDEEIALFNSKGGNYVPPNYSPIIFN